MRSVRTIVDEVSEDNNDEVSEDNRDEVSEDNS